jgi:hypothetical protein
MVTNEKLVAAGTLHEALIAPIPAGTKHSVGKIFSSQTANSKPVKQEVNGTVILPPLVFPGYSYVSII